MKTTFDAESRTLDITKQIKMLMASTPLKHIGFAFVNNVERKNVMDGLRSESPIHSVLSPCSSPSRLIVDADLSQILRPKEPILNAKTELETIKLWHTWNPTTQIIFLLTTTVASFKRNKWNCDLHCGLFLKDWMDLIVMVEGTNMWNFYTEQPLSIRNLML